MFWFFPLCGSNSLWLIRWSRISVVTVTAATAVCNVSCISETSFRCFCDSSVSLYMSLVVLFGSVLPSCSMQPADGGSWMQMERQRLPERITKYHWEAGASIALLLFGQPAIRLMVTGEEPLICTVHIAVTSPRVQSRLG